MRHAVGTMWVCRLPLLMLWHCPIAITWGVAAWNQLGIDGLKELEADFCQQLNDPRVHAHHFIPFVEAFFTFSTDFH